MKKLDDGVDSFESSNDFIMGRVSPLKSNILEIDSFSGESDFGKKKDK